MRGDQIRTPVSRSTEIPGDRGARLMDSGVPGLGHGGEGMPAPLPTVDRLARGSVRRLIFGEEIRRTEIRRTETSGDLDLATARVMLFLSFKEVDCSTV